MKDWRRRERIGSSGRQCPHATRRAQQDLSFTVGSYSSDNGLEMVFWGRKNGRGICWSYYYFLDALVNTDLYSFSFAALLYSYLN